MTIKTVNNTKKIRGIAIKTSNENAENTIPVLWGKFFSEAIQNKVSDKLSDSVFAIYTDFENEGKSNQGEYTFLIGVEVENNNALSDDLRTVEIPIGNYHVFDVETGKPEQVVNTWMDIWSRTDLNNSYQCDFEEYKPTGEIAVHVGTH